MGIMSKTIVGVGAVLVIIILVVLSFGVAYAIGVSPAMYFGAMLALAATGLIGLLLYLLGEVVLE